MSEYAKQHFLVGYGTPDHIEKGLNSNSESMQMRALRNPLVTDEQLMKSLGSISYNVANAAIASLAANKRLKEEHVLKAMDHHNDFVGQVAVRSADVYDRNLRPLDQQPVLTQRVMDKAKTHMHVGIRTRYYDILSKQMESKS